jgi:hypothetical protein
MPDRIWSLPLDELDRALAELPSLVTWSRLEPLSLSADLAPGLQAPLGDPLWLIGRQWQFDELRGEHGGSPVAAILDSEHAPIGRMRTGPDGAGAGVAVDVGDYDTPLEPLVEAEAVANPPVRIRAEGGLQLLRMLAAAGLAELRPRVVSHWGFESPAGGEDPAGAARAVVLAGRVPDAGRVEADVAPLLSGDRSLTGLPAGFDVDPDLRERTRDVLGAWLGWYGAYLATPGGEAAWDPRRQEYAFAVQASLDEGAVAFAAAEYASGELDWSDFDTAEDVHLGTPAAVREPGRTRAVLVPTPARFPGMPADRLWELEDGRVYLGGVDAGPTDLARMATVEFALAFGNDWYVLPHELPWGAVARIASLTVRDTFGVEVEVGPASEPAGWSMFGHGDRAAAGSDAFVIPPVLAHKLESDPIEEVALFRDEMANLVWGVERVVQGPLGEPVDLARSAAQVALRQPPPDDLGDAEVVWRLMSPVPDNWVPFAAVPTATGPPGSIELERRPLLHFRDDGSPDVTHPRGLLLLSSPDAPPATDRLRLAEEEVPRDGAVVTRSYQLARTPSGATVLWIGRRKRVGEGEGWSGLRFDTALSGGR